MKKKKVKNFYFLSSIFLVFIVLWGHRIKAQNSAITSTTAYKIDEISITAENDGTCNEISCCYLAENKYGFFLPAYADLKQSNFTGLGESKLYLDDILITDDISLMEVRLDYEYTAVLRDCTGNVLQEASVIIMKSANISSLHITTSKGDISLIDTEQTDTGSLSLVSANGKYIYHNDMKELSGRGNSTWREDAWGNYKKPYHIKLDESAVLCGTEKSKNWILLANGTRDKTYMANKLVYDLGAKTGITYSPSCEFVDVYANGIYLGNYLLCKKPGIYQNDKVQNLEKMNQYVNPDIDLESCDQIANDEKEYKAYSYDNIPEDITGGYVLEMTSGTLPARFHLLLGNTQEMSCGIKEPDNAEAREVEYISNYMREAVDAILSDDGYHPQTGKYYTEYIDLDSFVRKYLLEEITKNWDGGTGSTYYYKMQDNISNLIYADMIWDYDGAFHAERSAGSKDGQDPYGITVLAERKPYFRWYSELYGKQDFYNRMITIFKDEIRPAFCTMADSGIDEYAQTIRKSAAMDIYRYQLDTEYEEETATLKWFIAERIEYLSDAWLNHKYCQVRISDEVLADQYEYVESGNVLTLEKLSCEGYEFVGFSDENGTKYSPGDKIIVEEDLKKPFKSQMQRTLITELSMILFRVFDLKKTNDVMNPAQGRMLEIKEYIDTHYDEKLELNTLSEKFFLHPTTISKDFTRYCKYNINKYINMVRICEAAKLLENTQDSVTDIADKCGYESVNTFLRQFKNTMEISPLQYRKSLIYIHSKSKHE